MTGAELRQAIANKWDYSYDLQLRKTQGKIFLQVMWRYQEQQSFSMTEAEFMQHLDTIAAYLSDWGVVEQVQKFIEITKERPRLGKAVSIPLQIGARSLEWLIGN
jgi:Cdc6-like AAA superfamily ATPase